MYFMLMYFMLILCLVFDAPQDPNPWLIINQVSRNYFLEFSSSFFYIINNRDVDWKVTT